MNITEIQGSPESPDARFRDSASETEISWRETEADHVAHYKASEE